MYQGEDLIIAMGAPGSRWSGAIRMLSLMYENINTTDNTEEHSYSKVVSRSAYTSALKENVPKGKVDEGNGTVKIGWHRGAYWGPGNPAGNKFDVMNELTKEEIIEEFKKPFTNWDHGIKIIKSHWFSYHIPLLREMFPKAVLWAFYDTDEICLKWWHTVGGWDITYPNYEWYVDDETMLKQIGIENSEIRKYFDLKRYNTWQEAATALGFPTNDTDIRDSDKVLELEPKFLDSYKPNIYNNSRNFSNFLSSIFRRKEMGIINPR